MSELLICGTCGKYFRGKQTAAHDIGYGTCQSCKSWSRNLFFDTRFKLVREQLSEANRSKWDMWSKKKKENFVARLIETGKMI